MAIVVWENTSRSQNFANVSLVKINRVNYYQICRRLLIGAKFFDPSKFMMIEVHWIRNGFLVLL